MVYMPSLMCKEQRARQHIKRCSWLRAPNFLSFKGVPSPLPRFFRRYFHPLFINFGGMGYHYMFKTAKLSQHLNVTQSYFECSIWILSVMYTASYPLSLQKKQ